MRRAIVLSLVAACGGGQRTTRPAQLLDVAPAIFLDDAAGASVPFRTPAGIELVAKRTRVDVRDANNFSWYATIDPGEVVVISARNGRVYGTILSRRGVYRVLDGTDGRLRITEVTTSKLPALHPPHERKAALASEPVVEPDGPIEIVVAYTSAAQKAYPPVEAMIQNAVDLANVVSRNSNVDTTFHLAHEYVESRFDESNYNLKNTVELFAGQDDRELDGIHGERDRVNADVAILIVAKGSAYQGLSLQTNASEDTAFSVVDCTAATDNLTLAHELGHQLGLNDDTDKPPVPHAEGYGHFVPDSFRTLMTKPSSCPACPLIAYWSNPAVSYAGSPSGVAGTRDSASVLARTTGRVTRFRPKPASVHRLRTRPAIEHLLGVAVLE